MSEPHYIIEELTAYELLDALCVVSVKVSNFEHILVEEIEGDFHHYYNLPYPSLHPDPQIKAQCDAITRQFGPRLNQLGQAPNNTKSPDMNIIVNALMFQDRNDAIHSDDDIYEQSSGETRLHRSDALATEQLLILPSVDPQLIDDVGKGMRMCKVYFDFASSKTHTFFHLQYEALSNADPQSYLATTVGQTCTLIDTHNVNGHRVFAPKAQALYQEKLRCFVQLSKFLHPNQNDTVGKKPFAALLPNTSPDQGTSYLNLCDLRWHTNLALEPVKNKRYQWQVQDFAKMADFANQHHNPDDNQQWRELMGFNGAGSGYKIDLVEAPKNLSLNKQQIDEQRKLLRRQVDELNYKLTYLDSIGLKSPILRRFSQQQLLQLADFLRSFPITNIKEGRIKYLFSETDRDSFGLHYFMYDPGNAIIEAFDAFRARDGEDKRCTRFTIDPMWDSVYHDKSKHKIYVPEGKVMYPPLHGWRSSEMDQYMRSVMNIWFPELEGQTVKRIPEQPIYLFEFDDVACSNGKSNPRDRKIRISIVDEQKFEPFHERLGFFNANLELVYEQYETQGKETVAQFIVDMASLNKRKALATKVTQASNHAQALFEHTANTTAQNMATTFNQLLTVFTDKTQDMQLEVTQLTDNIRQQNNQLMQLNAMVKSMQDLGHELQIEDAALQTNLKQIDDTVETMTNKVDSYVSHNLAIKKTRIDEKITKVVDELKEQHRVLNKKISSLW